MTSAQKAILKAVLLLDLAMLLYPPFGVGFDRRYIRYDWLWTHKVELIDFVTLAAQIVAVTVIGLVAFLLAREMPDEKFDKLLRARGLRAIRASHGTSGVRAQRNFERGLFRFWLILSVLFFIAVFASSFPDLRLEFDRAARSGSADALVPVSCDGARGTEGTDYTKRLIFPWESYQVGGWTFEPPPRCWYRLKNFRSLYPEFPNLSDDELVESLYTKAHLASEVGRAAPWELLSKVAAVAVGVPLLVLVLGIALRWAIRGFTSSREGSS